MSFEQARRVIGKLKFASKSLVSFVKPADSVLLAAATIQHHNMSSVEFASDAKEYAANNGLLSVFNGTYSMPIRSGLQGATYTKLTRLANHSEVDACNAIVNDLFHQQLSGYSPHGIRMLCKVVGELHDNVASHACGAGFSAAQVYNPKSNDGNRRLEFAIADAGCGMLANVRRVRPEITSDLEAIQWCLAKGNTTARRSVDSWEQRLPDDCLVSPFPDAIRTATTEDHHQGEGLWQLQELIRLFNGSLSVLSGIGEFQKVHLSPSGKETDFNWQGTAIGFEIFIPTDDTKLNNSNVELEKLAERLGI